MPYTIDNLTVSPCSNPDMTLEDALAAYAAIGYRAFEAFTGWAKSALDIERDPAESRALALRHRMRFASMHLPPIEDDAEASADRAVRATAFAKALGVGVVIYKATSRPNYINGSARYLAGIEGLGVTPVLQNHAGSPISTLADYRDVIEGIGDPRMKTLLEVGHFHTMGVSWREGCDFLGDSIALVHVKDQIGPQSVPFGTGEIDLAALFAHMDAAGYAGDFVIEMEVKDTENTLRYLADALEFLKWNCLEPRHE